MSLSLTPADALSPEAFYSLYLGGLTIEDESVRLETNYILLALGRLGLTPDEVLHLHDGWIDWERGAVHVPEHDPCGCTGCWDEARLKQRQGDSRDLASIVTADCWSPSQEAGARRLAFGWSQRLSGTLHESLEAGTHLESSHATIRERIETAAENARHLDAESVSVASVRASALVFLASAGFGPRRLVDLTGVDQETAGAFARVGGGEVRDHLYRALATETAPSLCGDNSEYQLVCSPESFTREPFDPSAFDAEWRATRATETTATDRNPRPIAPPSDVNFSTDDLSTPSEPTGAGGPGQVASSLKEWVRQCERERTTDADGATRTDDGPSTDPGNDGSASQTGVQPADGGTQSRTTAGASGETTTDSNSGGSADSAGHSGTASGERASKEPTSERTESAQSSEKPQITEPQEFSVDTRLVAPNFENGRPTGGSIILGQEELVFLSRGADGISDTLRVELDGIANLAPGYVPDPLEGIFEETVGIAYHDDDDERRVIVVEIPSDIRWQFVQTIFAKILDGKTSTVTHRPEQPSAVGPQERQVEAAVDSLSLKPPDESGQILLIRLQSFLDAEDGRMTGEEGYEYGLKVHHLESNGEPITTEIRPDDDTTKNILQRHLEHYDNRRANRVRTTTLRDNELDILKSLYESDGGRNMAGMLDKDPDALSSALKRLSELDLIVDGSTGKRLTGVGYRVVSPKYDL